MRLKNHLLIKSFTKIDHKLLLSLLFIGIVPTVYSTIRIFYLGDLNSSYVYSIAGQLTWLNLLYEVIYEAIILPLFHFMGEEKDDTKEFLNRLKTGLLGTFCIYFMLFILILFFAKPLLHLMAASPDLIDASSTYIKIESLANVFIVLQVFTVIALISLGCKKYLYIISVLRLVLSLISDVFLVSSFPCSLNLGVNGIGISNIIVNFLLLIIMLFLLQQKGINVFKKNKMSFSWMKQFAKVGSISGIESLTRNLFYIFMIVRMVNVVNEQGTYWVANSFIWDWLLLPINALGKLIRKDTSESKTTNRQNFLGYLEITIITCLVWFVLIPIYKPFMKYILNFDEVDKLFELVLTLLPFYVIYAIQDIFDYTFYGLGKTEYMLAETVATNVLYYGTAFILWKCQIWVPTLENIALLFGGGIVFDAIVSLVAYLILLKKERTYSLSTH